MENLDVKIQELGYELAKKLDKNEIEKLLGVLANDGVYAMWIFSLDRVANDSFWIEKLCEFLTFLKILSNDEIRQCVNGDDGNICEMIKNKNINIENERDKKKKQQLKNERNEILTNCFHKLSGNLSNLLYFKETLERVLIYTRYHLKAKGNE